jgi:Family of unknown function (DUF5675)
VRITVQRETETVESTEGQMFLDGLFECYTLEPRNKRFAPTSITDAGPEKPYAIPAGIEYPWIKYFSPDHGFEVVRLRNVPGFTAIEIHPGNFPKDTLGCTVVGMIEQENFVGHSQEEFARLMAKLPSSGTILYLDPASVPGKGNQQPPHADVA